MKRHNFRELLREMSTAIPALASLGRHARYALETIEERNWSHDRLWGRYYTRGAMDPLYADEDAAVAYSKRLAKRSPTIAAAFLQGWAEHRDIRKGEFITYFRLIGNTHIEVIITQREASTLLSAEARSALLDARTGVTHV